MTTDADPIVNNWYENLDENQQFKVVALDETTGLVEIQHFDGDLEEIDLETWYVMEIEPIEDPEDWKGPLDDYDTDEDYSENDSDDDWTRSAQEINPASPMSAKASLDTGSEWDDDLLDSDSWEEEEED
jgi:hypothetical protein